MRSHRSLTCVSYRVAAVDYPCPCRAGPAQWVDHSPHWTAAASCCMDARVGRDYPMEIVRVWWWNLSSHSSSRWTRLIRRERHLPLRSAAITQSAYSWTPLRSSWCKVKNLCDVCRNLIETDRKWILMNGCHGDVIKDVEIILIEIALMFPQSLQTKS